MPPKPSTQGRRVTIDPAATAKATGKKKAKGRSTDPNNTLNRLKLKLSEEDIEDDEDQEDDEDDALGNSQETDSILRLFTEKLNKRSNKPSAKFLELEQSVKDMFQETRQSSLERRQVCDQMLAAALAGFNEVEQTDQNPGTRQIVKLRETRHVRLGSLPWLYSYIQGVRQIVATKVANSHEGAIGPINDEVKAATQGVEDSLVDHGGLRAQSRKRLGKFARSEFQRGLVAQEFATDAKAYIRHYKKLLLI